MIPTGGAGLIRKKCTLCPLSRPSGPFVKDSGNQADGLAVFGSGNCAMLQLAFLLRETDSERALAKPARFCSFFTSAAASSLQAFCGPRSKRARPRQHPMHLAGQP